MKNLCHIFKLLSPALIVSASLVACNSGVGSTAQQQTLTVAQTSTTKSLQTATNNTPANLSAIAKGNGIYVTVGDKGAVLVSADGENWNLQNSGVSVDLHSVVFSNSNNLFYAVGDKSTVISSPDGKVWTLYNQLTPINNLHSMLAVNGYLIIGAESSEIYEINLGGRGTVTVRNSVDNMKLISAAANNNVIILGSNDGSILYKQISQLSSANWSRATKFSSSINSLSFSNADNWFIAATAQGSVIRSSDGITGWSTPIPASINSLNSITVDPLSYDFMAVGKSGSPSNIVNSSNFNNWQPYAESYPVNLNQISCFESDCFIVGNNNLILKSAPRTSTSSPRWQTVNKYLQFESGFIPGYSITQIPTAAAYGNGVFVVGASSSSSNWDQNFYGYTSHNGTDWQQFTMPQQIQAIRMVFASGKFVILGVGGINKNGIGQADNVLTSTDGLNWSVNKLPQKQYWYGLTYGNGKFVAVGDYYNFAAYSNNGESWIGSTLPYSNYWRDVAYGNGIFLAVTRGRGGLSAISKDGITWRAGANFPTSTSNGASIIFNNGKFILQQVSNQYYTTIDGSKWEGPYSYPCSGSGNSGILSYKDKFINICQSNFYSSDDGINWQLDYSNIGNYNNAAWPTFAYNDNLALLFQANGSFLTIK